MKRLDDKRAWYRLIDANFNRGKEGLRVCEDVCRFVLDDARMTRRFKDVRHALTEIMSGIGGAKVVEARNIRKDVGTGSPEYELKRTDAGSIFYANIQRVKESIRVLEEFTKLIDVSMALKLKQLRYTIYALEQAVIKKM